MDPPAAAFPLFAGLFPDESIMRMPSADLGTKDVFDLPVSVGDRASVALGMDGVTGCREIPACNVVCQVSQMVRQCQVLCVRHGRCLPAGFHAVTLSAGVALSYLSQRIGRDLRDHEKGLWPKLWLSQSPKS